MKILYTSASFKPSYGGPAYSVARTAEAVAAHGARVALWAPDGSAPLRSPGSGNNPVQLLSGTLTDALNEFGKPDIFHDSGLWWPHNHAISRLSARRKIPLVISIRGMLSPWARKHKAWKKRIAWRLYQKSDLQRADRLHATSPEEKQHLLDLGLKTPVELVPNGIDIPRLPSQKPGNADRRAIFLGRIYPVKGLPMLIEAWSRVRPEGWILKIAGPDEGGHLAELQAAVKRFDLADRIHFTGALTGEAKHRFLSEADLFVLPSYSESFGMVVGEALAYRIPVLTTTATPWPMIVDEGCGWWVEPEVDDISRALAQACATSSADLRAMGSKGRQFVTDRFGWDTIANKFAGMYRGMMPVGSS